MPFCRRGGVNEMDPALWQRRFAQDPHILSLSPRSLARYHYEIPKMLEHWRSQGLKSLGALTAQHLKAYWLHLYTAQDRRQKKLSNANLRGRLGAALGFVRFLVRNDFLLIDVSRGLRLPKKARTLPRVILSEAETVRLLEGPGEQTALEVRDRAILEVFYGTGLRNSELRVLKVSELDWARHLLFVAEGKGRKQRWVPMGGEAEVWVQEYLAKGRPALARAHEETLFLSRTGRPLGVSQLAEIVARWAKRVGLEKHVTPHCLRHSCATHMLKRGANLKHLQTLLGHESIQTTQGYTRVELSELRQVLRRCHPRER